MQGDNTVHLVVTCADKPTISLLKRVAAELPIQLKKISEEYTYIISMAPAEGAVLVADGYITVKVSLTSPVLRDPQGIYAILLIELISNKMRLAFTSSLSVRYFENCVVFT